IQFTDIKPYNDTDDGAYTFEVILRRDGTIIFQYLTMSGSLTSATIGIQDPAHLQGSSILCNDQPPDYQQGLDRRAIKFDNGPGRRHVFGWYSFASDFFGQSDNVVFRIAACSGEESTTCQEFPFATQTFPFRVGGTQVQLCCEPSSVSLQLRDDLPHRL